MSTINLRKVPADLHRRAKAIAAFQGKTLRDFVVDCLRSSVDSQTKLIRDADAAKDRAKVRRIG